MKKLILTGLILTLALSAAAAATGCGENGKDAEAPRGTDNLQEIALPTEGAIVTDMQTNSRGELLISTMQARDDNASALAEVWKLNAGGDWEKIFSRELFAGDQQETSKEAIFYMIGDAGVLADMDFSRSGAPSYEVDYYYIDDMTKGEMSKVFDSEYDFATLAGSDPENVYALSSADGKLWRVNFKTGEAKAARAGENVESVFCLVCRGNSAYAIYRQKYSLSEEEMENAASAKEDPARYAKGAIYDMTDGSAEGSPVFDKAAISFFEKWELSGSAPLFYPDASSESEAYYLADGSGVYRIDENGETLVCYDEKWNKNTYLHNLFVAENGDIYLTVADIGKGEERLYKL